MEAIQMRTITPGGFREAFLASVDQVPQETLLGAWLNEKAGPFTSFMTYTVLVRTARALGLNSAQEYKDIDTVFYNNAVEEFVVAVEHENDNSHVHESEIPKLGKYHSALKVLISYPRGEDLLTRIAEAVSKMKCDRATWLIILGDRSDARRLGWRFYILGDLTRLEELA